MEVGERLTKISHEGLDIVAAAPRCMERVLQQHVRSGKFVDNAEVASLAPEIDEPAAYDYR
jgi:hypothetical protein